MGVSADNLSMEALTVVKVKTPRRSKVEQENKEDKQPRCGVSEFFGRCLTFSKIQNTNTGVTFSLSRNGDRRSTSHRSKDDPERHSSSATNGGSGNFSPTLSAFGAELSMYSHLRQFSFSDLKYATRNFRPDSIIGEGGFGLVFKGWIDEKSSARVKPGSGLAVAVKVLSREGLQGHQEWLAEINYLGQLKHPNLVKLVGFCIEDDQRILIYEFMVRGSLENHLFRRGAQPLSWHVRMKVALGAAKGLAFLHEEADRPVIYRDFKASNILLDVVFNPKLSDFGLAKDGPVGDKTHVSTRVMGTYGYAAPEYVMTGHLTAKSDVYSYGVVLLELLTGKKSMDKNRSMGQHNLVEWARPFLRDKKRYLCLMDPQLECCFPSRGASTAVKVAAQCLHRDPKVRPLMSKVVEVLTPLVDRTQNSTYYSHLTLGGVSPANRSPLPLTRDSFRATFPQRNGSQPGGSRPGTPMTAFSPIPGKPCSAPGSRIAP